LVDCEQNLEDEKTYEPDDRMVMKDLDRLLACKDMVEVVIGAPVNLQRDGKITIGFLTKSKKEGQETALFLRSQTIYKVKS